MKLFSVALGIVVGAVLTIGVAAIWDAYAYREDSRTITS